jgi:6-pyruvoyl-tetrahydropterin synthase
MKKQNIKQIGLDEFSIDSGQYLPESFGKCHRFHGHTYIGKEFEVKTDGIVDFNLLKKVYSEFDHYIIAPEQDRDFWECIVFCANEWAKEKKKDVPCKFECIYIPYEMGVVEYIAEYLKIRFLQIPGIIDVKFKLYETPKSFARINWNEE